MEVYGREVDVMALLFFVLGGVLAFFGVVYLVTGLDDPSVPVALALLALASINFAAIGARRSVRTVAAVGDLIFVAFIAYVLSLGPIG